MNDTEREQWVNNDEGLYQMWRSDRRNINGVHRPPGITTWVKENRAMIDDAVKRYLDASI